MPLAINYRRDLAAKIYQLTQYTPLQPLVDKTYDTVKMNDRFLKMNAAVQSTFAAIADLASQDPDFITSFFKGFVNCIYTKSLKYANKLDYKFISGFNSNGTPMFFSDERIVYSYPDLGDVTFEDFEYLVFKNGELMSDASRIISNTAYGIKVYIKSTSISNNDEVTLAVHRAYNRAYQMWKLTPTTAVTLDTIIDIPLNFPNFYSEKYLNVAIRRNGFTDYDVLAPEQYTITIDSANRKVRVQVPSRPLAALDTIIVYDTCTFWKKNVIGKNTSGGPSTIPPIQLTFAHPITNEELPLGVNMAKDLDIWVNGRHLIPDKHFTVSNGYDVSKPFLKHLYFNFSIPNNLSYDVFVMKNIPYLEGNTTYTVRDTLDPKGVEKILPPRYPILRGIGEMYVNGRFVDNVKIDAAHKQLLLVNGVAETQEFFFKVNPPITESLSGMINGSLLNASEYDKMVVLIGGLDELVTRYTASRPLLPSAPTPSFMDIIGGYLYAEEAAVITAMMNYILSESRYVDYVLDSNIQQTSVPLTAYLIDGDYRIDQNYDLSRGFVLQCNPSVAS